MKKVILQKELIEYINKEIVRIRKTHAECLGGGRDKSYMQGYKDGQINALTRVLNHLWLDY